MRERVEPGTRPGERDGDGVAREARVRRGADREPERGRAPWPVRPAGRTATARPGGAPSPEQAVRRVAVAGAERACAPGAPGTAVLAPPPRARRTGPRTVRAGGSAPPCRLRRPGGHAEGRIPALLGTLRRVAVGVLVTALAAAAVVGLGLVAELAAGPGHAAPAAERAVTDGSPTPVPRAPGTAPAAPAR